MDRASFSFSVLSPFIVASGMLTALLVPDSLLENVEAQDFYPQQTLISVSDQNVLPQFVDTPPGTTIVWRNDSQSSIEIVFWPKAVATTCRGPRGFLGTAEGIDRSVALLPGEIASLCLIEPNEYRYEIRYQTGSLADRNLAGPETDVVVEGLITVGGR